MKSLGPNFEVLSKEYWTANRKPIAFDFKEATSYLLPEKDIESNFSYQYIHYYPGRIHPFIPRFIFALGDLAHLDGVMLDPFAGSGTILLECMLNPVLRRKCYGIEINPVARLISKVKTTAINDQEVGRCLAELRKIFTGVRKSDIDYPAFKNRDLWFTKPALTGLCKLRFSIDVLGASSDIKDFFWVCFSSMIRKVAKADPYIPPPVVLKPEKYRYSPRKYGRLIDFLKRAENPKVWSLFEDVVTANKSKMKDFSYCHQMSNCRIDAKLIWDDASAIKVGRMGERGIIYKDSSRRLQSEVIDLILTSPPYLTAQKYIRSNRLELFWLGYSEEDVNYLEKESIGSESVASNWEMEDLGIQSVDGLVKNTMSKSTERAQNIHRYFGKMKLALKEMYRVLRPGGFAILVVGDNKVRGKHIGTYRLLCDSAMKCGFEEVAILKDVIRGRSMMTKRNGTGGLIKNEYVIILEKRGK